MKLASHRVDRKCGASGVAPGKKCHKPTALTPVQIAAGSTALIGGAAALGLMARARQGQRGRAPGPAPRGAAPGGPAPRVPSGPPRLPGSSPAGLLSPGAPRLGRTQRMRQNTAEAMGIARGRIQETAAQEVRRIAQIGNTMAAAGEASGMATKMSIREVKLRAEKLRRKYEPGYRKAKPKQQGLLSPSTDKPLRAQGFAPRGRDPEMAELPLMQRAGRTQRTRQQRQPKTDAAGETPGRGKPCGASHIAKRYKCAAGAAATPPEAGSASGAAKAAAAGVAIGAAAAGILGVTHKKWTPGVERSFREAVALAGNAPTLPKGSSYLARGYAGAVYASRDKKSVFKVNFNRTLAGRRKFLKEAIWQDRVHSAGVSTPAVKAIDAKRSIAQIEMLNGYKNLDEVVKMPDQAVKDRYAKQFMTEMSKLHKAGYAHSDMHLGNVMYKGEDVKLIDWGYARRLEQMPSYGQRNDFSHISYMLKKLSPDQHTKYKSFITKYGFESKVPSPDEASSFWDEVLRD